jgi:hypothetical protein
VFRLQAVFSLDHYQWNILQAIEYAFYEAMVNSSHPTGGMSDKDRSIRSVASCLAISKLRMAIQLEWNQEQIDQFNRYHQRD